MKFTGKIRVPEIDHPGVSATFEIDDVHAEVVLDGESLGRWSLYDVRARRLVSSAFQVELDGEEITFFADDPIDFAYRGVEHMAEVWARFKSMNVARRPVAVRRSRKGTKPSKIPEFRDAMVENLQTQGSGFLTAKQPVGQDEITTESVAQKIESLSVSDKSVESVGPATDIRKSVIGETTGDEADRLEAQRAEAERVEQHRLESEHLEEEKRAIKEERARLDVEKQSLESDRLKAEQKEADRAEAFGIEMRRLESERQEQQNLETKRSEASRQEMERLQVERADMERLEAERAESVRIEIVSIEKKRIEIERLDTERAEQERQDAERREAIEAEMDRLETQRAEDLALETERADLERLEAKKLEQERIAAERAEAEIAEKEPLEAEKTQDEDAVSETPPDLVKEILPTSGDSDDSGSSEQLVVDLGELEEPVTEPEPDSDTDAQPEPVLAGAYRARSGIMGAVKSAFGRGGRNHTHEFVEAPGGLGISRSICEECGYVSISSSH